MHRTELHASASATCRRVAAYFPKLTVKENLVLGTRAVGKEGRIDEQVFAYFPILQERLRQIGGTLSGGEQQMLAIARALCGQPKVPAPG